MRTFSPVPSDKHQFQASLSKITSQWRRSSEQYGFLEYTTPILEPKALYAKKSNEDMINHETYSFTPKESEEVIVLRPEITPSVARLVGEIVENRSFTAPLKLFTIGSVYRHEKEQHGRKREHIQWNADIFGVNNLWADIEIISLAIQSLKNLGIEDVEVRVNDRENLYNKLTRAEVSKESLPSLLRILDKKGKISDDDIESEMKKITNLSLKDIDALLKETPKTIADIKNQLEDTNIVYRPDLVRGFNYYTGIIFEIFSTNPNFKRSLAGGGRYDTLVEQYSSHKIPACGFGMGDVIVQDIIDEQPEKHKHFYYEFVVTAENDAFIQKGIEVAKAIRKQYDVSFLGILTNEKKYKKIEQEGGFFGVSVGDTITLRNLLTREDVWSGSDEKELLNAAEKEITSLSTK